jgi:hypothetical protein
MSATYLRLPMQVNISGIAMAIPIQDHKYKGKLYFPVPSSEICGGVWCMHACVCLYVNYVSAALKLHACFSPD